MERYPLLDFGGARWTKEARSSGIRERGKPEKSRGHREAPPCGRGSLLSEFTNVRAPGSWASEGPLEGSGKRKSEGNCEPSPSRSESLNAAVDFEKARDGSPVSGSSKAVGNSDFRGDRLERMPQRFEAHSRNEIGEYFKRAVHVVYEELMLRQRDRRATIHPSGVGVPGTGDRRGRHPSGRLIECFSGPLLSSQKKSFEESGTRERRASRSHASSNQSSNELCCSRSMTPSRAASRRRWRRGPDDHATLPTVAIEHLVGGLGSEVRLALAMARSITTRERPQSPRQRFTRSVVSTSGRGSWETAISVHGAEPDLTTACRWRRFFKRSASDLPPSSACATCAASVLRAERRRGCRPRAALPHLRRVLIEERFAETMGPANLRSLAQDRLDPAAIGDRFFGFIA